MRACRYDDDADINSEFDAGEDDFDDDSVSHESGDNIFLSLAQGREEVDDDFGGKGGHRNRATTTNTALAQYLMGSNSQTLLTLIQHARRWTNSLVPAAKKTRINTTFAAAVERVGTSELFVGCVIRRAPKHFLFSCVLFAIARSALLRKWLPGCPFRSSTHS